MPPYNNYIPGVPIYTAPQSTNYSYQPQPPVQNQIEDSTIWVEGENAAKSYIMKRNSRLALWDSTDKKIYLKTIDNEGKPSTITLKYEIIEPKKPEDIYITKEEFNDVMTNLTNAINDLKGALTNVKSSVSTTKPTTAPTKSV